MKRVLWLLVIMLCITGSAAAQIARVEGLVFDSQNNEPVVGATVRVEGSNKATVTDVDGKFVFTNLTAKEKKLTVTYVGFEKKTVAIHPEMKIYISPVDELMDELIVVAFGKQKRESFTGSASVVNAADIAKTQVTNPVEALNGRVSGLTMTMANGVAGESTMRIRGISSINAGKSPLIVLDGMPFNGDLNDINPDDVENMTVLKDAASNALYGARGANGVILITTKSGAKDRTKVNVEIRLGANTNARVQYDRITDPGQYYEAHYLQMKNYYMNSLKYTANQAHIAANKVLNSTSGMGSLGYMVYSVPEGQYLIGTNGRLNPNASLGNRVAYNGQVYTLYPDNWLEEGTRTGLRQEYNVSISSGKDKMSNLISVGYLNNQGIAYGSELERFNGRIKTEFQAFPFLRVGASASYTHTKSAGMDEVFQVAYGVAPIYPLYVRDGLGNIMTDKNGRVYDYGAGNNAGLTRHVSMNTNEVQSDRMSTSKGSTNAVSVNGFATLDFWKGFSFTVNGNTYVSENRGIASAPGEYGYYAETGGYSSVGATRKTSINFQQLLNYNRQFGEHLVSVLVGHEYTRDNKSYLEGNRSMVALYGYNKELNGAIIDDSMSSYSSMYNVEGWMFRGQYDYASKYFASASYRRDGSSNFHPDHRWGNFWSVGGAWIMTKEDWFPKGGFVNMLKLKASYGEQGNDGIGAYKYVDTYTIKNSNNEVSYAFSSKGNPDITWETVGNLNTGVEFELFNSRLNGGVEFYTRTTSDMLMYFAVPSSLGYSGYYKNVGDMNNRGVEIDLQASIIKSANVNWNLDLNVSFERNRVSKLPATSRTDVVDGHGGFQSGNYFIGQGLPMYSWYIQKYAGVASAQDVADYKINGISWVEEPGMAMYYKTLADGTEIKTTKYGDADNYLFGSTLPKVFGGFSTNLKVFNFDLNAQFNYSIGGLKYDSSYAALLKPGMGEMVGGMFSKEVFNAWSPENQDSNIPRFQFNDQYSSGMSDRFLTDASQLTLSNVTVGYNFPKKLLTQMKMQKLRVYFTVNNVWYVTKRTGWDPRANESNGIGNGYAPMRTFTGGLSLQF